MSCDPLEMDITETLIYSTLNFRNKLHGEALQFLKNNFSSARRDSLSTERQFSWLAKMRIVRSNYG